MSALVVGSVPFLIPDEEPKERFKSRSSMNFSLDENLSLAANGGLMKQIFVYCAQIFLQVSMSVILSSKEDDKSWILTRTKDRPCKMYASVKL